MQPCPEKRRLSLQGGARAGANSGKPSSLVTRRKTSPLLETTTISAEASQPASSKQKYRVVVMGTARVGKTSLVSQFLYDTFSPKYVRTVEDLHTGEYEIRGQRLLLEILDTSGAYQFPAMRQLSIASSDGFVLVCSLEEPDSFDQVKQLREEILSLKQSQVPVVVVANKCDLVEVPQCGQLVSWRQTVEHDWKHGFVETSAKQSINVVKVFKELLSQANVNYELSPAVARRRQSLPVTQLSTSQLSQLRGLNRRHTKRSSCSIA